MNYLLKSQMFEPTTPPEAAALRGEEGELAASWCIAGAGVRYGRAKGRWSFAGS